MTFSILEKPVKSKIILRYSGRQSTKKEAIFSVFFPKPPQQNRPVKA